MTRRAIARPLGLARVLLAVVLGSTAFAADQPQGRSALDGLRSKDVAVRRDSANKVRDSGRAVQKEALPTLIDLLMGEKDGQVRLAVLDTVTALGPDAEAAVPALVHTLKSNYGGQGQEESHQDYRSALALASIGKPAVEGLRGLLKERKESVRAEVVMALGRIGPEAEPAVPDLVPLLGDPGVRVRREAPKALGLIGLPAVDALIAASSHSDPIARAGAVEGLGYSPEAEDRVTRSLVGSSSDPAPEVRSAAVRSLARHALSDDVLLPIARANLRNDDERARLAVVHLLVGRRDLLVRMAPDLEALLADGREGVARHAAFLLGKSGPDAAPRLVAALRLPTARVEPIAGALAQVGRPAVDLLTRSLEDPEPRVRRASALALGQVRPLTSDTAKKLTRGLGDPDAEVRGAFLTAVGSLGSRGLEAVPAIRGLLRDGSPEIRARAVEVLFQAAPRDGSLLDDFASLVDDPDAKVQRQAIDALRALGPPGRKALPAVIARLTSPDPEVRFSAAQMVESYVPDAVEAIPALSMLLEDPAPKLRTLAATTLGKFGKVAQPAFPSLAKLLGDEGVTVREAAVSALGSLELDAEALRPHLARALRDEKSEVRRAASRAIPRLGPSGVILVPDIILMAARKENARTVDRLLRPFERSGPDVRSLPELVEQLQHEQVAVRLLAIKFLGLAGRNASGALPALERTLEDPSAEVRQQAKAACEQIKNAKDSNPK